MVKSISMAQLAKHAERITDDINASGTIYCVKRRGKAGVMLIDADYFEGWRIAIELMQGPSWREEWAESRRAAERGEGRNLSEVALELGLDRPAQSKRRAPAAHASTTGRAKGLRGTSRPRSSSK